MICLGPRFICIGLIGLMLLVDLNFTVWMRTVREIYNLHVEVEVAAVVYR